MPSANARRSRLLGSMVKSVSRLPTVRAEASKSVSRKSYKVSVDVPMIAQSQKARGNNSILRMPTIEDNVIVWPRIRKYEVRYGEVQEVPFGRGPLLLLVILHRCQHISSVEGSSVGFFVAKLNY